MKEVLKPHALVLFLFIGLPELCKLKSDISNDQDLVQLEPKSNLVKY